VIIFLASYPKSGNTWLRAFLANWLADHKVGINEMPAWGMGGGDARIDLYREVLGSEFIADDQIPRLRQQLQRIIALKPGHTFMKTHNAIAEVDGIQTIDPHSTAGAIYIARDPRDVCISYARHYGISIDDAIMHMASEHTIISQPGKSVETYLGSWSYHVLSWVTAEGLTLKVLRYEDMKENPGRAFKKVIKFLGQSARTAQIKRAVRHTNLSELQDQEAKHGFQEASDNTDKFFGDGQSGGWRAKLTAEQASRIEKDHAAVMERFGYA
tara:strand:+ start:1056 stop:1865 length:810 start_codon:yes stop_codon:yes gene_type:complete